MGRNDRCFLLCDQSKGLKAFPHCLISPHNNPRPCLHLQTPRPPGQQPGNTGYACWGLSWSFGQVCRKKGNPWGCRGVEAPDFRVQNSHEGEQGRCPQICLFLLPAASHPCLLVASRELVAMTTDWHSGRQNLKGGLCCEAGPSTGSHEGAGRAQATANSELPGWSGWRSHVWNAEPPFPLGLVTCRAVLGWGKGASIEALGGGIRQEEGPHLAPKLIVQGSQGSPASSTPPFVLHPLGIQTWATSVVFLRVPWALCSQRHVHGRRVPGCRNIVPHKPRGTPFVPDLPNDGALVPKI